MQRLHIIIPQRNIISDAVNYIRTYGSREESDMRTWFNLQNYDQDYHYFETRLMTRDNIIKKYNVNIEEYVFYCID